MPTVPATSRKEFSTATKRIAWERSEEMCESERLVSVWDAQRNRYGWEKRRCCAPLSLGCFHFDHIDNVWTSRNNSLENCQVLCTQCHKEKTKRDVAQIAKTKRIINKRMGFKASSSRPMPFGRSSPLKKKISGEVVPR
jgi:hypothetical protein